MNFCRFNHMFQYRKVNKAVLHKILPAMFTVYLDLCVTSLRHSSFNATHTLIAFRHSREKGGRGGGVLVKSICQT